MCLDLCQGLDPAMSQALPHGAHEWEKQKPLWSHCCRKRQCVIRADFRLLLPCASAAPPGAPSPPLLLLVSFSSSSSFSWTFFV